jgi:ribosome-associated translation inhibitor RaiA
MKFVSIFADVLFAVEYEDRAENEYDRLMELWTDASYLFEYAKRNGIKNINKFKEDITDYLEEFEDFLDKIKNNEISIGNFFQPLKSTTTSQVALSFQKGKIRQNHLRLYALKIGENMFLITGGAIKMSLAMQDHVDTKLELNKLAKVQQYLKQKNVFDEDSFYELLME